MVNKGTILPINNPLRLTVAFRGVPGPFSARLLAGPISYVGSRRYHVSMTIDTIIIIHTALFVTATVWWH